MRRSNIGSHTGVSRVYGTPSQRSSVPARRARTWDATRPARWALIALMVGAFLVAVVGLDSPPVDDATSHFETLTVAEGASLWSVAAQHPVPGLDTVETVEIIRSLNRLDGSVIHVGQTLRVPARTAPDTAVAVR